MDGRRDGADVCPLKGMKGEYAVLPERHSQGRLERGVEVGVDMLGVRDSERMVQKKRDIFLLCLYLVGQLVLDGRRWSALHNLESSVVFFIIVISVKKLKTHTI